jgi:hydrogenase maturation protein HypF
MCTATIQHRPSEDDSRLIVIKGLVQGIGFRPFVYRMAHRYDLAGWIENRTDSVWIKVQGNVKAIDLFTSALRHETPSLAKIKSFHFYGAEYDPSIPEFLIHKSKNSSSDVTEISPDIAVCDACLQDMHSQPHRINYPFINCTYCGPRFSIVQDLPYDRDKTTMDEFAMCDTCRNEYGDVQDRRFHAQTIACNHCGPQYELKWHGFHITEFQDIMKKISSLLTQGKIIAIKGIGGFHLICNALDAQAAQILRLRKKRDDKPFAVMFSSIEKIKEYADVSPREEEILVSRARPIVLLKMTRQLSPSLNYGLDTLGAMLPYMPIHYLIFQTTGLDALVFTSGNKADEPITKDNDKATEVFGPIADAIVSHNRYIANRVDDSVVRVAEGSVLQLRRSRGYVPEPVTLSFSVDSILAVGPELKNCFALGKGNNAILSQHIGDLKFLETYDYFVDTIDRFKRLFRVRPRLIVRDMHPDYLSSHYAMESGLPVIEVQHHHSHIASCMAEHGIDRKVIGVSFDGTGLGDDGTIWGSEFLICDLASYARVNCLQPVPLPGGDKAGLEPWRMALSYLYALYGKPCLELELPFYSMVDISKQQIVLSMLEKHINLTQTSGAGRLFDAVSALLGICVSNAFEAEAALKLEACIDDRIQDIYPFEIGKQIHTLTMIQTIVDDIIKKRPVPEISAAFHNTVVSMIARTVDLLYLDSGIKTVILSGGSFQNRYLFSRTVHLLKEKGFEVFWNNKVPCNDGGISLGQLAIAAKRS